MTRECSTELEVNGGTVILRMKKLQAHVVCLQLGFLSREKLFPIKWAASNMKGSFVSKHETKGYLVKERKELFKSLLKNRKYFKE
ncbi:hypothetical protein pdam_00017830 [Pocillopora damicornis]|uniref:Uncharacterized protein n=1 Tax=Pocillopora damicornis TaxID=46731 RepID=A0A3M6TYG3_POCDA|nr:hypothetical protein pdam_00017830 [Pocillopora damicornis]